MTKSDVIVIGPFEKLPVQLYEVGVPPLELHAAVRVTCPPPNGRGVDGLADTVQGPGAAVGGGVGATVTVALAGALLPAALLATTLNVVDSVTFPVAALVVLEIGPFEKLPVQL